MLAHPIKQKSRNTAALMQNLSALFSVGVINVPIVGSFADEPDSRGNAGSNAEFFAAFRTIVFFTLIVTVLKLRFYMKNSSAKVACFVIASSWIRISSSPIVQDKSLSFHICLNINWCG